MIIVVCRSGVTSSFYASKLNKKHNEKIAKGMSIYDFMNIMKQLKKGDMVLVTPQVYSEFKELCEEEVEALCSYDYIPETSFKTLII